MNTQPITMPYVDEQKLHVTKEHLTEIITDQTEDYARSVGIVHRFNPFYPKNILRFFKKSHTVLFGSLISIKNTFETTVESYKVARKQYRELTVTEEDTILQITREEEQLKEKTSLQKTYLTVEDIHIKGNIAKGNILLSNAKINTKKGELLKSQEYLNQIRKKQNNAPTYPDNFEVTTDNSKATEEIASSNPITIPNEKVITTNHYLTPEIQTKEQNIPPIKTHKNTAPDYFVAEQQQQELMETYGEYYAQKHKDPTIEEVTELSLSDNTKNVLKDTDYKCNILGYVSLSKIIWAGLVYVIAVTGEILIFTSILGRVFNFQAPKSYISGAAALLISFVIGFSIYGMILQFIKNNNRMALKLLKSSRLLFLAVILSLIYTASMGVLFNNTLQMDDYNTQLATLTQEKYVIDSNELDEDMTTEQRNAVLREKGTKIGEIEQKIAHVKSGPVAMLTAITIALSSSIFMLLSGIMFGILLLFSTAYKKKQQLKKLSKIMTEAETSFYSTKQQITTAHQLGLQIINHIGQREFIRRLLAGGSPKEVIFENLQSKKMVNKQQIDTHTHIEQTV